MKKDCLLKRVEQQEFEARKFGFCWTNIQQLINQVQSECLEVEEAWQKNDRPHLQEELGDLIQAAISLAVFCEVDPHETLLKSIEKFQTRYDHVVKLAKEDGFDTLHNKSSELLIKYWNSAKENQAKKAAAALTSSKK